jgi:2-amino-4-hydroxy-6-hydroxymethyldihydropteridine diphosphokinase
MKAASKSKQVAPKSAEVPGAVVPLVTGNNDARPTMIDRSTIAAIALGSNLGDRRAHIDFALAALRRLPRTDVTATSTFHETRAIGKPGGIDPGGPYLNAAALLRTALAPRELLEHLLRIETERGRQRGQGQAWAPRTLDLDLLLYGDHLIEEPGLVVPHPRMHQRLFVLAPLAEIAPDLVVPVRGGGAIAVNGMLERLRKADAYAV